MRHKIQSAFSRQKAAKVEEDTLSVTSEDSDIDVNDTGELDNRISSHTKCFQTKEVTRGNLPFTPFCLHAWRAGIFKGVQHFLRRKAMVHRHPHTK